MRAYCIVYTTCICLCFSVGCERRQTALLQGNPSTAKGTTPEQLDAQYAAQLQRIDEQLQRTEDQQERFGALLGKWEEQVRRVDALLQHTECMMQVITTTQSSPASEK